MTLINPKALLYEPSSTLLNDTSTQANHSGLLPGASILSPNTITTYVFPGLANEYILSIGQLYDNNSR